MSYLEENGRAIHIRAQRAGEKPVYRKVFLIEEFLDTSTRWTFDPTSHPYESRGEAERRRQHLQNEYPWAAFRVVSGEVSHKKTPGGTYGRRRRRVPECIACGQPLAEHSKEQNEHCAGASRKG
jgi:hypothetical protein